MNSEVVRFRARAFVVAKWCCGSEGSCLNAASSIIKQLAVDQGKALVVSSSKPVSAE